MTTRVMATRAMETVKETMATAAMVAVVVVTVTAMVTVTAVATTTERGSAKAKGKQATAKTNRRSSSMQHNNQPTTKQGSTKVEREKQTEAKRRSSGTRRNNQPITEQGSANVASGMHVTVTLCTNFATSPCRCRLSCHPPPRWVLCSLLLCS